MKKNSLNKAVALALMTFSLLSFTQAGVQAKQEKAREEKTRKYQQKACQTDKQKNKQMEKISSFNYHQSGGFAAINRTYSVKLADLSKEDRENLEKLIVGSGLLAIKKEKKTTPGAADMFFYEFSASNGCEHSATYDDGQLPDAFRPLVEFAQARASSSR